jgi:hypothetical protein
MYNTIDIFLSFSNFIGDKITKTVILRNNGNYFIEGLVANRFPSTME